MEKACPPANSIMLPLLYTDFMNNLNATVTVKGACVMHSDFIEWCNLNKAALAFFSMPFKSIPAAMLAINFGPSFVHAAAYEDTFRANFAIVEPVLVHAMLFRSACNLSAPEQILAPQQC